MKTFNKKTLFLITFFSVILGLNQQSFAYDPYTRLGTSNTSANPRILNDSTTGIYTSGPGKIDFSITGVVAGEFSSTGLVLPNKVAIGTTSFGSSALTVNGTTTSTSFSGIGSSLTNLNASNISSGTVGAAYLPTPTTTTLGAVFSKASATSHYVVSYIDSTGTQNLTRLGFTDLSGSLSTTQLPALSGDISSSAGSNGTTLATVNSNVGTFGSASTVATVTVNSKGLTTAAASTAISIGTANLSATGTPSSTTFLRGDNTWATPAGGGGGTAPTVTSISTGTSNTLSTLTSAFTTIAWNSASTGSKSQVIPACTIALNGYELTIKDEYGSANTYYITVTPSSGTIEKASSFVIGTTVNSESDTFQCDGAATNWMGI